MLRHEVYTLHIYRSRAVSGWQWAAWLEHLPEGESRRFSDPKALLAHLKALLQAGDDCNPSTDTPPGVDGPTASTPQGGTTDLS